MGQVGQVRTGMNHLGVHLRTMHQMVVLTDEEPPRSPR